jgi:hypothetical protein
MLHDDDAEPFLASVVSKPRAITNPQTPILGSGDRQFDFALAQTLYRMTETFGVVPGFAFYDDYDGPNAFATTARKMRNPDGTVLFGMRYLKDALAQNEHPDIWVTSICAHEFGHIVQYKRGVEVDKGQRTVKRSELHADFLSGYYAGVLKLQRPSYPAAIFAAQEYSVGSYDSTHKDFLGTPDERARAVVRGFETGYRDKRSLGDAIAVGIRHVQQT